MPPVAVSSRLFVDIVPTLAKPSACAKFRGAGQGRVRKAREPPGVYIDERRRKVTNVRRALGCVVPLLLVAAAAAAQEAPAPTPAPAAAPAPPTQPFKLHLRDLIEMQGERGHAEFDMGFRREWFADPMVRLAYTVGREEASQFRGGPPPITATTFLMSAPRPDMGLVLAGPFGRDWEQLTTQEKIGRMTETAVTWSLFIALARALR